MSGREENRGLDEWGKDSTWMAEKCGKVGWIGTGIGLGELL